MSDWVCPACHLLNYYKCTKCSRASCGMPRPARSAGRTVPLLLPGDWTCKCGALNVASTDKCSKCAQPRSTHTTLEDHCMHCAAVASKPTSLPHLRSQHCPKCHYPNCLKWTKCSLCDTLLIPPTQLDGIGRHISAVPQSAGDPWTCTCGATNTVSPMTCFKCAQPRSAPAATDSAVASNISPSGTRSAPDASAAADLACLPSSSPPPTASKMGDWVCPKCHFLNFSRRATCNRAFCNTPRPSTRAGHQPRAEPLKLAGDWTCTCGVLNFASRDKCFKCAQPRAAPSASSATATAAASETRGAVEDNCSHCMAAAAEFACLPCLHLCLCAQCAASYGPGQQPPANNCPMCRGALSEVRKVFVA